MQQALAIFLAPDGSRFSFLLRGILLSSQDQLSWLTL